MNKGLHLASNKTEFEKKFELKRFIDEFGTHYPISSIMGVKILSERTSVFQKKKIKTENHFRRNLSILQHIFK